MMLTFIGDLWHFVEGIHIHVIFKVLRQSARYWCKKNYNGYVLRNGNGEIDDTHIPFCHYFRRVSFSYQNTCSTKTYIGYTLPLIRQ